MLTAWELGRHLVLNLAPPATLGETTTVWDVYEAKHADALSAGQWQYGGVTEDALEALKRAARTGAFTVKDRIAGNQ